MHLLSSHIRLPSRRQVRLFWQSFLITALFGLLFHASMKCITFCL